MTCKGYAVLTLLLIVLLMTHFTQHLKTNAVSLRISEGDCKRCCEESHQTLQFTEEEEHSCKNYGCSARGTRSDSEVETEAEAEVEVGVDSRCYASVLTEANLVSACLIGESFRTFGCSGEHELQQSTATALMSSPESSQQETPLDNGQLESEKINPLAIVAVVLTFLVLILLMMFCLWHICKIQKKIRDASLGENDDNHDPRRVSTVIPLVAIPRIISLFPRREVKKAAISRQPTQVTDASARTQTIQASILSSTAKQRFPLGPQMRLQQKGSDHFGTMSSLLNNSHNASSIMLDRKPRYQIMESDAGESTKEHSHPKECKREVRKQQQQQRSRLVRQSALSTFLHSGNDASEEIMEPREEKEENRLSLDALEMEVLMPTRNQRLDSLATILEPSSRRPMMTRIFRRPLESIRRITQHRRKGLFSVSKDSFPIRTRSCGASGVFMHYVQDGKPSDDESKTKESFF